LLTNSTNIKTPQINVSVIQSNVQDIKNISEIINNINISEIKKEELKKLFLELEKTAKDKSTEESTKNNKLRQLFKEIVNISIDAGIVGLRWVNENGLINRLFGN
ncbi:MAG: hypothetical protein R3321_11885, partial [Nitrososphaeraceae archaeon]|nr:hypothetical protein [Nitrososphaeraceae archaeon]